ncbi:GNAT family N-acetyltransferase [Ornithinimicrobium sp. F0845]|uniref:GNAT family N-acetyltransferase n=1 Tax=Ornithinimicrobium sp. F0845 TaxID=2926412 RepID=UPI001FF23B92|nr:GNAT family protein [Ornithinimicrobium sp. F0845]MCK0113864.1 GNAT family N-acetyltransferase [Ornithinimicrobium sp. F0845]
MLPDTVPTLGHDPIVLRAFRDEDAALVQSVATDPLIPLITTVPTSGTSDDAIAYIQRQRERLRTGAGYSFAIAEAGTDEAVGQIGLWLAKIDEGRASTGYWVAPQRRRRGYVTAALHALTDWALRLDDVHRLELYVEPWNDGSWRAAEACGYTREGLLRSWQQVGDERRDMYMYSRIECE